jgi:predicted ATP-binding protein involved in virulence
MRQHPPEQEEGRQLSLARLELNNYRCFASGAIDFHPRLTVLVADNAQGKSAVLAAITIALEPVIAEVSGTKARAMDADSVRLESDGEGRMRPCLPMVLGLEAKVRGVPLRWTRSRTSPSPRSGRSQTGLKAAITEASELRRLASENGGCLLPVVAFYRTDRLWTSVDGAARRNSPHRPLQGRWGGYADWTSPTSSFGSFVHWYRNAFTRLGDATSKFHDPGARIDKQILAVHEAVRTALQPTGWTSINWEQPGVGVDERPRSDFISIEHPSRGKLPLQFLSDGIQNMVALVADLAYRCVVLNPHLGESAAQETTGVVLIDEVDMHLHPRWQQVVIDLIRHAFPRIQFIVTTHSPQVLSTVDSESIRLIRMDGPEASISQPRFQTRGIESADILARLMDVDPVPQVEEAKWLSEYRALLQLGKQEGSEATALWACIVEHFGADNPVLNEIEVLRRFQEFRAEHSLVDDGKAGSAEA